MHLEANPGSEASRKRNLGGVVSFHAIHMNIHVYIHVYIHINIYMHVYIHVYMNVYECILLSMNTFINLSCTSRQILVARLAASDPSAVSFSLTQRISRQMTPLGCAHLYKSFTISVFFKSFCFKL